MKWQNWYGGVVAVIIIILGVVVWSYYKTPVEKPAKSEVAGENTFVESYFSDEAQVMYFYSENCSWCIKEKKVLEELAKEGYRVKPIEASQNLDLFEQYQITGTPSFVAKNGDKLVGYQEYDELKAFLDKYR